MRERQTTLAGDPVEPHKDPELLRDLYEDHDAEEIADQCDCSIVTVQSYLRGFGITQPSDKPAYFQTRSDGYEYWTVDQHTVYVHRLVAVAEYGIEAVAGGHVHHRNGLRWDNRPENLQPLDGAAAHRREHARPKPHDDQQPLAEYPTTESGHENGYRDPNQLTFEDF